MTSLEVDRNGKTSSEIDELIDQKGDLENGRVWFSPNSAKDTAYQLISMGYLRNNKDEIDPRIAVLVFIGEQVGEVKVDYHWLLEDAKQGGVGQENKGKGECYNIWRYMEELSEDLIKF